MELFRRLPSLSNSRLGHWGWINVVVNDFLSFKIDTLFNQLSKKARELKHRGKHGPKSWIFHEKGDKNYKSLQEISKSQIKLEFERILSL